MKLILKYTWFLQMSLWNEFTRSQIVSQDTSGMYRPWRSTRRVVLRSQCKSLPPTTGNDVFDSFFECENIKSIRISLSKRRDQKWKSWSLDEKRLKNKNEK